MQTADEALVQAVLADWQSAPVNDKVRATLAFLERLTVNPTDVTREHIRAMLDAGVTKRGIEEAIQVCFEFSVINRIADALDFEKPDPARYTRTGKFLHKMGYNGM